MQLGRVWGLRVLAHCSSHAEATLLEARFPGLIVLEAEEAEGLKAKVKEATGGIGVDIVYESRGSREWSPAARRARIECLAPQATWCLRDEMQVCSIFLFFFTLIEEFI